MNKAVHTPKVKTRQDMEYAQLFCFFVYDLVLLPVSTSTINTMTATNNNQ
jgi:hypothetical protein